jgi:probable rRNA maturation factor
VAITVDVQYATGAREVPDSRKIRKWARACLEGIKEDAELAIRIVDEKEGAELNRYWRAKKKATNVLSFPAGENPIAPELLGDIVICAPVILREARAQGIKPDAHWAHMVIHGILHLLGYDHLNDKDARQMETIEIKKLKSLKFSNPYE